MRLHSNGPVGGAALKHGMHDAQACFCCCCFFFLLWSSGLSGWFYWFVRALLFASCNRAVSCVGRDGIVRERWDGSRHGRMDVCVYHSAQDVNSEGVRTVGPSWVGSRRIPPCHGMVPSLGYEI